MLNIISTRGQSDTKIKKWRFPKLPSIPLPGCFCCYTGVREKKFSTYLSITLLGAARLKARVGRFHSIFNPIFITVDNGPMLWCCSSRLRKQMYNNSGHCIAKPAPTIGHCAPICSNSSYKTPAPLFRGIPPQLVMIWAVSYTHQTLPTTPYVKI